MIFNEMFVNKHVLGAPIIINGGWARLCKYCEFKIALFDDCDDSIPCLPDEEKIIKDLLE